MVNSCITSQSLCEIWEQYPYGQVDKRSHLVLFKQNQRNHDPYTSELQKACKTDYLVNRHNMMGTVSKLYVSNNTWIYVYIKKNDKISTPILTPTPESFNSNSNFNSGNFNSNSNANSGKSLEYQLQLQLQLREFQLQLQFQLRQVSWISTPTPTPTPEVSTPIPTPTPELELNPTPTPTPELTPTLISRYVFPYTINDFRANCGHPEDTFSNKNIKNQPVRMRTLCNNTRRRPTHT